MRVVCQLDCTAAAHCDPRREISDAEYARAPLRASRINEGHARIASAADEPLLLRRVWRIASPRGKISLTDYVRVHQILFNVRTYECEMWILNKINRH